MAHRAPIAVAPVRRKGLAPLDPFYGYGYNPAWPSILSVAHDESDGGRLLLELDRPCVLGEEGEEGELTLPLIVPEEGAALTVVAAEIVLPVKLRVTLDGPVPVGAAWRWSGGVSSLYDPITGHFPNAARGVCADFPGPYTPPMEPPVLVEASFDAETLLLTLGFDRAVDLSALDPAQLVVDDGPGTHLAYVGSGSATVVSPSSLTLAMMEAGMSGGMATLLIASGTTGIVSDEGGAWAGTGSGVGLPLSAEC